MESRRIGCLDNYCCSPFEPISIEWSITGPGHETPLASCVSTNVSMDVKLRHHDSIMDVDSNHHDPGQDQDQPSFNRL
eukprot:scaffold336_cov196-Amphora_coffeaeformis.AAC.8